MKPTANAVERAQRILHTLLPEITSHDHAMDNLFYVDPNNDSTRLPSIAAALFILKEADAAESPAPEGTETVKCEACDAGMRLAPDGIHYDESRGGVTWGVCRKIVAALRLVRTERAEEPRPLWLEGGALIDAHARDMQAGIRHLFARFEHEGTASQKRQALHDFLVRELKEAHLNAIVVGARAPQGWQPIDLLKRIVIAWDAEQFPEINEMMAEARKHLGFRRNDEAPAPPDRSPRVSGAQEEKK